MSLSEYRNSSNETEALLGRSFSGREQNFDGDSGNHLKLQQAAYSGLFSRQKERYPGSADALETGTQLAQAPQKERTETAPSADQTKAKPEQLVEKLGDDDFDVRENAQRELQKAGFIALPYLKDAVKNSDIEVRERAQQLVQTFYEKTLEWTSIDMDVCNYATKDLSTLVKLIEPTKAKPDEAKMRSKTADDLIAIYKNYSADALPSLNDRVARLKQIKGTYETLEQLRKNITEYAQQIILQTLPPFADAAEQESYFDAIKLCSRLGSLRIAYPDITNSEWEVLQGLPRLEKLELTMDMKKLPGKLPEHLTFLYLNNCQKLEQLPDVLPSNLRNIYLEDCTNLKQLPELPDGVIEFYLNKCVSLKRLPDKIPNGIIKLNIVCCENLERLPDHLSNSIMEINLYDCKSLEELPNKLPDNLRYLRLIRCESLKQLPDKLPDHLWNLELNNCTELKYLSKLPDSLKYLDLSGCVNLNLSESDKKSLEKEGRHITWP